MRKTITLVLLAGATLAISGCFDGLDKEGDGAKSGNDPPAQSNAAPTISGAPPAHVLEGESFDFTPFASDADGDTLEFSISRKPVWATFDSATGRLSGTPGSEDVGNFTNIAISVSDGQTSAALSEFNVSVDQIATGAASINWMPPTENEDGTVLTNLAGYRIYYGLNSNNLDRSIVLNNPGLTSYVVENLQQARWYFSMTSVNTGGKESTRSATVSKTIG